MGNTASLLSPNSRLLHLNKIAAVRARDSVRRASDFVQIALSLIDRDRVLSDNAWWRHLERLQEIVKGHDAVGLRRPGSPLRQIRVASDDDESVDCQITKLELVDDVG